MKFEFKFNEIDQEALHRANNAKSLTDEINQFFNDKEYGQDVLDYKMICILVKTRPGYEDWYKVRRPKYIDHEVVRSELTGETFETRNTFIHEIKVDGADYEYFVKANDLDSVKFIASRIIYSLEALEKIPKKIKDFDKERFTSDLESYFKERDLI